MDRLADISSSIAATISNPDKCNICAANDAITLFRKMKHKTLGLGFDIETNDMADERKDL